MAKVSSYSESWVKRIIPFIAREKGVDLRFYCICDLQHLTTESDDEKDIWKIPSKKINAADLLIFITQNFSGMPNFTFELAGEN